jgi:ATP-dependent Lhr-like helicase
MENLHRYDIGTLKTPVEDKAIDGLKFSECLPTEYALKMLESRLCDTLAVAETLQRKIRYTNSV